MGPAGRHEYLSTRSNDRRRARSSHRSMAQNRAQAAIGKSLAQAHGFADAFSESPARKAPRTSSAVKASKRTSLLCDVPPCSSAIAFRSSFNRSARKRIKAAFALCSNAGARTLPLIAPPCGKQRCRFSGLERCEHSDLALQ